MAAYYHSDDAKLDLVIEKNPGISIEVDRELARDAEAKAFKEKMLETNTQRTRRATRTINAFSKNRTREEELTE